MTEPSETPEQLVRSFFEQVWGERRYELLPSLFHDDCVTHQLRSGKAAPGVRRGPAELEHHIREWFAALPDAVMEAHELVADAGSVAVRATLKGTHLGPWNGLQPTGRPIQFEMMVFYRIADGKIAEDWVCIEAYGAFEQLGLVPPRESLFAR